MVTTTKKTIIDFLDLPESVKTWLSSSEIVYMISEMNQRLNFRAEKRRIIPTLVLRISVGDLEPENFIKELMEKLDIGFSAAKILAQEIEEKLLKPIEASLKTALGIDLKAVYVEPENLISASSISPSAPTPAPTPAESAAPKEHNEGQEVLVVPVKPVAPPPAPPVRDEARPETTWPLQPKPAAPPQPPRSAVSPAPTPPTPPKPTPLPPKPTTPPLVPRLVQPQPIPKPAPKPPTPPAKPKLEEIPQPKGIPVQINVYKPEENK